MSLTDYRSLYDKEFIGAWDLKDGDMVITITKVVGGQLVGQGGKKSKKPVVYFRGSDKGFAVNATNGKAIATMYGTHIENWVGKKIALYKSSTRNPNGDGDVECVRVRPQAPKVRDWGAEIAAAKTDEALRAVWEAIPQAEKPEYREAKDEKKATFNKEPVQI